MPSTEEVITVATPRISELPERAQVEAVGEEVVEVGQREAPRLVGDRVVEDAAERVDQEEDQERPDEPDAQRRARGYASSATARVTEEGKLRASPRRPTGSGSWCHGVPHVGLEHEPDLGLHVVAHACCRGRTTRLDAARRPGCRRPPPAGPRATFSGRTASTQPPRHRARRRWPAAGRARCAPPGRRRPRRPSTSPGRRLLVPTKSATKRVRGRSYSSRGGPTCSTRPSRIDRHAVGERERLLLVVGHVDRGDAELALEPADLRAHLDADLGVEVRERLVEQQDVRIQHQRARQGHPLLLAARELARIAGLEPGQVDLASPSREARADLLRGRRAQPEPVRDVVAPPSCAARARSSGTPCRCGARRAASPLTTRLAEADGRRRRAGRSPASSRRSVVLPQPDGPSRVNSSPSATVRSTASTAVDRAEPLHDPLDADDHRTSRGPRRRPATSSARPTWPRCPSGSAS